jgi:hypothetical protein
MGDISKQNSTGQNRRAAQEATQQDHNKLHLAHGIIGKIREKQEQCNNRHPQKKQPLLPYMLTTK